MTIEGDLWKLRNLSRHLDQISVEFCIAKLISRADYWIYEEWNQYFTNLLVC